MMQDDLDVILLSVAELKIVQTVPRLSLMTSTASTHCNGADRI